jgi:hypothetical protein
MTSLLLGPVLALLSSVAVHAPDADAARDKALTIMLDTAFPDGTDTALAGGRELFEAVLQTDAFLHKAIGPFDLYVFQEDGLGKARNARQVLEDATRGLARAAPVLTRWFDRPEGLVSSRRFPIVLTSAHREARQTSFDQIVALLDHCEDGEFSGWKPVSAVWSGGNLGAEVVRTWEVQVFNLAHLTIAAKGKQWFDHGIGYYAIAHVANRLLRQGAWGMVPPWLAQGLIDELDIEAYGEAWVGGDTWESQTPGWSRDGWSGFVPQGSRPPPPVTGPPADLAVTVRKTGDSWEHRSASPTRHWADLATDRKSEAPASFAFMARTESFLPRDRAYARFAMNLLLDVAPAQGTGLLERLDREVRTPDHGMPDGDPLPAVFARSIGGVPAVEALEALDMRSMLVAIGRPELVDSVRKLGAEGLLDIADHREQSAWLYGQPRFDAEQRGKLFDLILQAEYYQQLHEWNLIGEVLDTAADAAFEASRSYPGNKSTREKVAAAVRRVLGS